MKSRISTKGQVTVPVEVRDRLGLLPGTSVHFVLRGGEVVMRKGGPGPHPVDLAFGKLRLERPVDQLVDEMRGPRLVRRRRKPRLRKR